MVLVLYFDFKTDVFQ